MPSIEQDDRREFLKACGRFAAVTPPTMTLLLSTSLTSTAIARSGVQGSGDSGGSGGSAGSGGTGSKRSIFDNDLDRRSAIANHPSSGGGGSKGGGGSGKPSQGVVIGKGTEVARPGDKGLGMSMDGTWSNPFDRTLSNPFDRD